jgi:hypothetical protein
MKKQIFTIILFTMVSLNVLGQSFKLDATGANDMRLRTGAVDRMYIHPTTGSIGIATTSPNAKLDINGDLALTKKLTYSTPGTQNALDRQGASRIYISGTVTLNGIAGGEDGMVIFLYTSLGSTLTINNESLSALTSNRIATHTGATVTITARGGVSMIYDSILSTWRIFGFADENSTWNAKGNAGTVPSTNFIGTTDSQGFAIRTNNTERMRIIAGGNTGIGTPNPDTKLHVVGTVDNDGTNATFKITDGGDSMLFDGNEIDGAGNGPIYLNNNSTGGVFIGANGTGLKEIIKKTVSVPTFTVTANNCSNQDVSITNVAVDSAVSASPDNGFTSGLFIAYARVSSAGIVRIRVCNFTASSITQSTSDFHVAVVR